MGQSRDGVRLGRAGWAPLCAAAATSIAAMQSSSLPGTSARGSWL